MLVDCGVGVIALFVSGLVRLVASDHPSSSSSTALIDRVFLPPTNDTKEFENLSIEALYEYHDELQRLLQAVNYQIATQGGESVDAVNEARKRVAKRSVGLTVSASLPDRNSSFFLDRIAERNSSSSAEEALLSSKEDNDEQPSTAKPVSPAAAAATTTTEQPSSSSSSSSSTTTTSTTTTKESVAADRSDPRDNYHHYESAGPSASRRFKPLRNRTAEECIQLSQTELVSELKEKGTYNPDFMAWDVPGVIRFLDKTVVDQYERDVSTRKDTNAAVEKNLNALERILRELDVHCDVRSPEVIAKLYNLTTTGTSEDEDFPHRSVSSPSMRRRSVANDRAHQQQQRSARHKRAATFDHFTTSLYLYKLYGTMPLKDDVLPLSDADSGSREERTFEGAGAGSSKSSRSSRRPDSDHLDGDTPQKRQKIIGQVHVVPFGCDKRGTEEDGYLRLCGACQAIRRLPDDFFPPFINEVMCDEDKACLYFYDYPHGKCKQKHMNFVVLRNVGSPECQIWRKFNLNVRVSCECFVDEMSFFAKYV